MSWISSLILAWAGFLFGFLVCAIIMVNKTDAEEITGSWSLDEGKDATK